MAEIKLKLLTVGSMGTNCYIIYRGNQAVVVDPGDDFFKIDRFLKEQDLTPEAILLTHGHFDHIGAAEQLKNAYGIMIYAMDEERETLENPRMNLSGAYGDGYGITADVYLRDGEVIKPAGMEFKVLFTPGHTPGGCCYYLEEKKWLLSGDTLFRCSVGRTDFSGGSMGSLVRSIKEKLLTLPDDTKVFPGHMEPSAISVEKEYNPFTQE